MTSHPLSSLPPPWPQNVSLHNGKRKRKERKKAEKWTIQLDKNLQFIHVKARSSDWGSAALQHDLQLFSKVHVNLFSSSCFENLFTAFITAELLLYYSRWEMNDIVDDRETSKSPWLDCKTLKRQKSMWIQQVCWVQVPEQYVPLVKSEESPLRAPKFTK